MHPSREELAGFLFGTLDEAKVDAVADHVEQCAECKETAERLNLSLSSIQRMQREAVHGLARALWEHRGGEGALQGNKQQAQASLAPDWPSQTKLELASLRASAPDAVSEVSQIVASVLDIAGVLITNPDVVVTEEFIQPDLTTAVHPVVLRQILIAAIRRLGQHAVPGQVTVYAGFEDGSPKITITGAIDGNAGLNENDLTENILTPEDVSVEARLEGDYAFVWIKAPSTGTVTVLIVDDNPDVVHFYRRSTTGTRYRIAHIPRGQELFEAIEEFTPSIIVLDVMLPDVDGWELLMRLHETLSTRSIPVMVCSVVQEKDLAISLGAALYLTKPVRGREFIQALDQILAHLPA